MDHTLLYEREHYPRSRYGVLLEALSHERAPVLAIEPGWSIPDDPHYAPELRYYMMVAREKGRVVEQAGDLRSLDATPIGAIVATCHPEVAPILKARLTKILVEMDGCVASRKEG